MGLDKFVKGSFESYKEIEKTALIFDTHNLIFRTLFVAHSKEPLDLTFRYWKVLMLQSIYNAVKKFKPSRLIFALDQGDSWRKSYYSDYKEQRKAGRDESPIDFDKFFPIVNEFFDAFKTTFSNTYVLNYEGCEGDDIIAVLVKDVLPDWKCTCISTDRDMYQLYKHKNYKQYDPIKKTTISCLNPSKYLLTKIIMGDKGDNIPAIADRVGIKTAEKMLENLSEELKDKSKADNFERNKVLIDFDCIPDNIRDTIKNSFNSYETSEFKGRALMDFFAKVNTNGLVAYLQEYVAYFKPLI